MVTERILKADLSKERDNLFISVNQYDNYSRKYRLVITDNGVPRPFTSQKTIRLVMQLQGEPTPYYDGLLSDTWEGGYPVVTFTASMLFKSGIIDFKFYIYEPGSPEIISTRMQHLKVQKGLIDYDGIIASEEFETLSDLIAQATTIPTLINDIHTSIQDVNDKISEVNTKISQYEQQLQTYETTFSNMQSEQQAVIDELHTYMTNVENAAAASAKNSESWAIGGTGTRPGENTNNSKYFSEQANASADRAEQYAGNVDPRTLSQINATDARGLLGTAGSTVNGQSLVDKIADNLDIVRTFKNKKILIFGDSISDEALTENLAPNWVAHLRTKLNGIVTSITNNSHSGRKMIELPDIVNSYSSLDQDIVIIFLGTNDWDADIPLGNYGTDYATKYSDAIKKTFENINSKYSTRKPLIYFITPLWRNNAEGNSLTYNVDFYRKPIIGFCKRYGTRWINGEGFPYMSDYYKLNNDIFFDDVHPNPWFSEYMCTHIINRIMADGDCDFNNGALVKNLAPFYSPGNVGTVYAYFCNNDLHIKGSFARNPTSGETLFTVLGTNPELISDVFGTMFYPITYSYASGGTAISGTGLLFTNNDGTLQVVTNNPLTTESTNFKFDIAIKPTWCNILKEL